jgi:hypothetical protein
MGLLDEAIREHLELKRRSGADPGAVERDEQEAFSPPPPGGGLDDLGAYEDEESEYEADVVGAADTEAGAPLADDDRRHAPSFADLADAGQQDTAELDMQAAMDEGVGSAGALPYAAPSGGDWAAPYASQEPEEDSLEWELPGDREREPPPENIPGQERLTFE